MEMKKAVLTVGAFMIASLAAVDYPYSSDYQTQNTDTQDRNAYPLDEPDRGDPYNPNRLPQENYYRKSDNPERYRSYNPNPSPDGSFENPDNTKNRGIQQEFKASAGRGRKPS